MKIPDIWSIITGVAGVISLIISLRSKYKILKKYTIPIFYILIGFALGRFTITILPSIEQPLSKYSLIALLVFIILFVTLAIFYIAMKYNQPGLAYMGLIMILLIGLPNLVNLNLNKEEIPIGDYIVLAKYKEQMGDFGSAIEYLEKCKYKTKDKEMKKQIEDKISKLKLMQLYELKTTDDDSFNFNN